VLRPTPELVTRFLEDPSERGFRNFRRDYLALLRERWKTERNAFDALASRATAGDVFIGCNCPTHRQPDVLRCHTSIALEFIASHYPKLSVVLPTSE
jgi:hypothetical protein